MIEKIVGRLLDDLAAVPAGEAVDIKGRYFYPLSTILICDLLGIPEEDRDAMLHGAVVNARTTNTAEESEANLHQWQSALGRLVEAKRREPGDDAHREPVRAPGSAAGAATRRGPGPRARREREIPQPPRRNPRPIPRSED